MLRPLMSVALASLMFAACGGGGPTPVETANKAEANMAARVAEYGNAPKFNEEGTNLTELRNWSKTMDGRADAMKQAFEKWSDAVNAASPRKIDTEYRDAVGAYIDGQLEFSAVTRRCVQEDTFADFRACVQRDLAPEQERIEATAEEVKRLQIQLELLDAKSRRP